MGFLGRMEKFNLGVERALFRGNSGTPSYSLADETPEGKSIVELAETNNPKLSIQAPENSVFIKFTAETRASGLDTPNGLRIRKGAFDSIRNMAAKAGHLFPAEVETEVKRIAPTARTPSAGAENEKILGVV